MPVKSKWGMFWVDFFDRLWVVIGDWLWLRFEFASTLSFE
jgi:hypothetical protein